MTILLAVRSNKKYDFINQNVIKASNNVSTTFLSTFKNYKMTSVSLRQNAKSHSIFFVNSFPNSVIFNYYICRGKFCYRKKKLMNLQRGCINYILTDNAASMVLTIQKAKSKMDRHRLPHCIKRK